MFNTYIWHSFLKPEKLIYTRPKSLSIVSNYRNSQPVFNRDREHCNRRYEHRSTKVTKCERKVLYFKVIVGSRVLRINCCVSSLLVHYQCTILITSTHTPVPLTLALFCQYHICIGIRPQNSINYTCNFLVTPNNGPHSASLLLILTVPHTIVVFNQGTAAS